MAAPRLTIAVVSDAVLPYSKGGKETRLYHLTTELAKLGHDVHVYTMQWWEGAKVTRHEGVTYHAISRLYPLYHRERRSIPQGLIFALSCFKLVRYNYDILEVDHMPFLLLFPLKLVSLVKRRPMFATWHEVWGAAYWREYLGASGYLAAAIERASVFMPDHIVAVSAQTKAQLRSKLNYHRSVDVVPNGIDLATIRSVKAAAEQSDIIYTGRLLLHKNVDLLIRAVGRVAVSRPDIRCLIIGDGPERDNLEALSRRLGLSNNLSFAGFVESNRQVYAAMKASRIFVLPSIREGFGVSVIEAQAAGLAVVTVDHPENAARHLVEAPHGIVCKPTTKSIAVAIEELLVAERPVKHRRANDDYAWKTLATQLSEVYER